MQTDKQTSYFNTYSYNHSSKMKCKRVGKRDANTDNTPIFYRRGNRRTRRKTSPRPSKRSSIHQTISWDTQVRKRSSKPNLPSIPKPTKLLLQQGFSEPCLVQLSESRNKLHVASAIISFFQCFPTAPNNHLTLSKGVVSVWAINLSMEWKWRDRR